MLGGSIRGGAILGDQLALNACTLFQNRDYPVLNEYRAVLGGLFADKYGLNARQLDAVFPGVAPKRLALA